MTQKLNRPRIMPRKMVYSGGGLIVVAISMAITGFFHSMGGGALGIILVWSSCVLGLIAGIITLISGLLGSRHRWLSFSLSATGALAVGISLLSGISLILTQLRNPMKLLSDNSKVQHYSSTRIECLFGSAICIIDDPHNQIRFCFGEAPSSVEVIDDLRIVRFVDTSAVLKSLRDGISVDPTGIKIGGWMGAYLNLATSAFKVDQRGYLQATNLSLQPAPKR